jgi:hypothetical protein
MKILLISMLVLNFLTEGPVGAFLVVSPEAFLPSGQVEGILWARNYGVAALCVASMIFWVWRSRDVFEVMGVALGFLMTFHTALTIALLTSGGQVPGAVLHFILATACIVLFFQRAKWCIVPSR